MAKNKILNYTSTVSASKSIADIESVLVAVGVRNIVKQWDDHGNISALHFSAETTDGIFMFRLPIRVEQVEKILQSRILRPHSTTDKRIHDQAVRTAWKILLDWCKAQAALIQLGQAEMLEVLLPYIYDGRNDRTYYQFMRASSFKALPRGDSI